MLKPDWLVTWLISLHNSSFNIQKILCPTANDNPILFSTPNTTQTDRPEWVHWRWGQTDFPGCLKTLPVSQQSRPRLTPEKLCSLWNITNQCHTQQSISVPAMRCRATLIGIMPLYVASLESGNVAKQMEKLSFNFETPVHRELSVNATHEHKRWMAACSVLPKMAN